MAVVHYTGLTLTLQRHGSLLKKTDQKIIASIGNNNTSTIKKFVGILGIRAILEPMFFLCSRGFVKGPIFSSVKTWNCIIKC